MVLNACLREIIMNSRNEYTKCVDNKWVALMNA